jgi:hypothetical protein
MTENTFLGNEQQTRKEIAASIAERTLKEQVQAAQEIYRRGLVKSIKAVIIERFGSNGYETLVEDILHNCPDCLLEYGVYER